MADLFLLPSDSESFGLAALEAMACEVPVIASDVGGLPEVVTNGVDGYLIEPRDVAAGAKYALQILTLPDRGRAMGQQARINARRKYCSNDVYLLRGVLPEGAERLRRSRARLVRVSSCLPDDRTEVFSTGRNV